MTPARLDYATLLRERAERQRSEHAADGRGPLTLLQYRNRQALEAWRRRLAEAATSATGCVP